MNMALNNYNDYEIEEEARRRGYKIDDDDDDDDDDDGFLGNVVLFAIFSAIGIAICTFNFLAVPFYWLYDFIYKLFGENTPGILDYISREVNDKHFLLKPVYLVVVFVYYHFVFPIIKSVCKKIMSR
jgi:hypothetical protein